MSNIARNLPASCIGRQLTVVRETGVYKIGENYWCEDDAREKFILDRRPDDVAAKEINIASTLVEIREKITADCK